MSQSLSKIYTHLVFATKDRADIIPTDNLSDVHAYIAEILNKNGCHAIAVGGTTNHVHILYVQSSVLSLSDTVRIIKSNTSKWINSKNGKFTFFCWQDGYGAFSISESHVNQVVKYIHNQQEHHKHVSYKDEFRRLCQIFNINLDERYVWN